jgi:hypothetical protein
MHVRVIAVAVLCASITPHATPADAGSRHAKSLSPIACTAGAMSVDSTPVLRIAIATLIDRPNRGVILDDHSIVVITENGHALVGFDSAGRQRWQQRISRAGSGGFSYFSDVLRNTSGQAVVWDHMLHRLSGLDGRGTRTDQRRLRPLPRMELPDGGRTPQHLTISGIMANGQVLATTSWDPRARDGVREDSVDLFRFDVGGTSHRLGRVLLAQQFSRTDPYHVRGKLPFGRVGLIAVSGSSWFYSDGSTFRIERHRIDGAVAGVLSTRHSRRPVNTEAIRRSRLRSLAMVDSALRSSMIRALAAMPYPDTMAAYSDLKVDAAGTLWARIAGPDWEGSTWDLYHPLNGWLMEVRLPPNLRVLDIGRERLLAYHESPGERTALHVYHVCRP